MFQLGVRSRQLGPVNSAYQKCQWFFSAVAKQRCYRARHLCPKSKGQARLSQAFFTLSALEFKLTHTKIKTSGQKIIASKGSEI